MPSLRRRTGAENACSPSHRGCFALILLVGALASVSSRASADDPRPETVAPPKSAHPEYSTTIKAASQSAPKEDIASDASVITNDRTPRAGESVADLLSEQVGVSINRTGGTGSLSMISLRGSTWDQVNVYIDGVPLNDGVAGGVDLSTLPLGDVDRIEIYRGSTPIAFGSSAMGGVISITTRAPRSSGISVEGGAGSFGTEAAGITGAWAGNRVRLYLGAHYLTSIGNFYFTDDNGTPFDTAQNHQVQRQNNWVNQVDGVARAVIPLGGRRELSISQTTFTCNQGLPGFGSVRQTTDTSLNTLRFIGSVAYDSHDDIGSGGRVRALAYTIYGDQKFTDPHGEISVSPEKTNDQTWTYGTTLNLSGPVAKWLTLSGVFDARYEQFFPFNADVHPAHGATSTRLFGAAGIEADGSWPRARLHIVPSVRVEAIDDQRTGIDSLEKEIQTATPIAQVAPTGRIALVGQPIEAVTLRATGGRYVRFPTMYELYGNSGFVLGNPALKPESGWNADLGIDYHAGHSNLSATISATLFASYAYDLIQFQQDSYGRTHALNLGQARILGAEASAVALLTKYARLNLSGTFMDAHNVSPDSMGALAPLLPNLPRFHAYIRPEGRLPPVRGVVFGAYVDTDFSDGNYLDAANLVALPPRVLVGAGLFAEDKRDGFTVTLSGQNLADVRTFDFAGFPLPSRSFFLSARYTYAQEPSL